MSKTTKFIWITLAIVLMTAPVIAKSIGVQLREALYQEQVGGDLDAAIEMYQKVIGTAVENKRYAGQAHFRLGMCYLKKGEEQKAIQHFETILKDYSDQRTTVSKAKKELKKIKPQVPPEKRVEVKSLFEQIDGQVLRFIAEKYGEIALEANQKSLYVNCHIYYAAPDFILYRGGMGSHYNWTGRTIASKVRLSGTSYPNQTHYDVTGNKLNTEIVPDKSRPNHWQIYWIPDEPLAPEEALYYGWSIDDTRKLSQMPGEVYSLRMQNQFGSPAIETFFLVLPKELQISQSNPATGSKELLNFDVYWWTKTVQQGENHLEQVGLRKISGIVGRWQSVDFVSSPDQFRPSTQQWKGDFFLKEITFNPDGSSSKPWNWTDGWIHETDGDVKAEYYIKRLGGEKYLFFPWLSGDVTIRGQKPKYYVLKTVPGEIRDKQNPSGDNEKTEIIREAIKSAESWLKLVDSGNYPESWKNAAEFFKKAMPKKQWNTSLEIARKPLGDLISREVLSTTYTQQIPGAPDGEYVVITFKASYENKKIALETVTPMLDKDGKWRVSGYYIN